MESWSLGIPSGWTLVVMQSGEKPSDPKQLIFPLGAKLKVLGGGGDGAQTAANSPPWVEDAPRAPQHCVFVPAKDTFGADLILR